MASKIFHLIWIPLAAVLLAWAISLSPVYARLDYWLGDFQLKHSAKQQFFGDSLVVDIDEASVRELQGFFGGWPYKRDTYALVNDYLMEMGAQSVVFDILLPDAREGDAALQSSIARHGNVFLAATGLNDTDVLNADDQSQLEALAWQLPPSVPAYQWRSCTLPHSGFAGSPLGKARVGVISVMADEDGVFRRLPLVHKINGKYLPTLALAAQFQDAKTPEIRYQPEQGLMFVNGFQWPVDSNGSVRLNFPSNNNAILNMPFSRLARAILGFPGYELDREVFRNKTVLVGSTAFLSDRVNTPVGTITGIYAQAMAFESLKHNLVLKPQSLYWNGLIMMLALVPSIMIRHRSQKTPLTKGAYVLGGMFALYAVNVGLLMSFQQQSLFLFPFLVLILSCVFQTIASLQRVNQEQEAKIHVLALEDGLTHLPNRFSLRSFLDKNISDLHKSNQSFAVIFFNLDHFKSICNSQGHGSGDQLLIEVANRLRNSAREGDFVARLGGDEFILVVQAMDKETVATHLMGRVMENMSQPYHLGTNEINTTVSVGISMFPDDGRDVDALIKGAESAMNYAKSQGRDRFQFFTPDMQISEAEYFLYESSMRTAISRNEFFIHYQPQIDTRTGRLSAMEALVRWQHPEHGVLQPDKFIHIAEDTGLILPLGNWILRSACQQLKRWHDEGLVNIERVAVNLSTLQFQQPDLPALVQQILAETGLEARHLELEITESVAMTNPKQTTDTMKTLKAMGVALAIDDFGTGHSSLNYLKLFPFDCLKIDRSFVQDIERDTHDAAICSATIALANTLGLDVVAEGVETEGQYAFLKDLKCGKIQGYYFSKPLSSEDAFSFASNGINAMPGGVCLTAS